MPFQRTLSPSFVEELNRLYDQEGSWWRSLVDDPKVFVGIRKNSLNAYAGGGSIARIQWNGRKIQLTVHTKYLVFADPGPGKAYCDLLAGEVPRALVVDGIEAYTANLGRIKKAATMLTGLERQAECSIGTRQNCVIDIEAAFNTTSESPESEDHAAASTGRLDMVVANPTNQLSCVELKLFTNAELRRRGGTPPAVCGQLIEYWNWLERNQQAVLDAYRQHTAYFGHLSGRFFVIRRRAQPSSLDTVPRLLIVGHDRSTVREVSGLVEEIVSLVQDRIPGFSPHHVQTVGGYKNVQSRHLVR